MILLKSLSLFIIFLGIRSGRDRMVVLYNQYLSPLTL
jgi:hypothetical protein